MRWKWKGGRPKEKEDNEGTTTVTYLIRAYHLHHPHKMSPPANRRHHHMRHLDKPEIVENVSFVEEHINGGLPVFPTF